MGDREGRGRGRNTTTVVDLSESNNVTFVVFFIVLMGREGHSIKYIILLLY